jgi:hypothetical protein
VHKVAGEAFFAFADRNGASRENNGSEPT